ncbi:MULTISPECIES: hypothetical protein [unclassified Chelatococcus]|uniref:hypothetical protein n=1 Tax=unclassified Chelatococcus TaxID=2638111 RepID=UPI001BD04B03|nr:MULTISPECIES: hypothetical protein [unclassified Chelatococcus]MBS7700302.1 hypothetical protein [Chelatococcus sp. YT9]MBX3558273.1 hypothetical protein [Chelatococcus sp.]
MPKELVLKFEGFPEEAVVALLEDEEPKCSQLLWEEVKEPLKVWCSHTTSTGDYILARGRPEREPQPTGTQASPLGSKTKHLSNLGQGSIVYAGNKFIAINYGPDNTEPVSAPGPIVARAKDLDVLYRAGRHVWKQHKNAKLVTIMISRRGA